MADTVKQLLESFWSLITDHPVPECGWHNKAVVRVVWSFITDHPVPECGWHSEAVVRIIWSLITDHPVLEYGWHSEAVVRVIWSLITDHPVPECGWHSEAVVRVVWPELPWDTEELPDYRSQQSAHSLDQPDHYISRPRSVGSNVAAWLGTPTHSFLILIIFLFIF